MDRRAPTDRTSPDTLPSPVVREAVVADLPAITGVQVAAEQAVDVGAMRAAVLDEGRLVVVVTAGGVVVGWAKTHRFPDADGPAPAGHYLAGVTVHPRWRRHGLGTDLTAARMDWLAARTDRVHYLVNAGNAASIALHRRWGFVEVARASAFHGLPFAGGVGLLMTARTAGRPVSGW